VRPAKHKHATSKLKDFAVALQQRPIDPTDLVVLAVRLIVSSLAAPELVSLEKHWYVSADRDCQQEVLDLADAQHFDCRIAECPLDAIVRTVVLRWSISIVLSIGIVMFMRVANQGV
jgi:hypothetical protein